MASILEKEILLSYASIEYLLPEIEDDEMQLDKLAIAELKSYIFLSPPEHLDYQNLLDNLFKIKNKYANALETAYASA